MFTLSSIRIFRVCSLLVLLTSFMAGVSFTAADQPLIVNSLSDVAKACAAKGKVCLRTAIMQAQPNQPITFSVSGKIMLRQGPLQLAKNQVIVGPGADKLTIDGADKFAIFIITSATSLSGLTLQHGAANDISVGDKGGAIDNRGQLSLNEMVILDNSANFGGAIANETGMSMSIHDSTINSNTAKYSAGAIENYGTLTIDASTLNNNISQFSNGAIENFAGATLTISHSLIDGNTAKAAKFPVSAVENVGTLILLDSTLSHNVGIGAFGGGTIRNDGVMTVSGSTVADNQDVGIANNSGSASIIANSTITGNQASTPGAGVSNINAIAVFNGQKGVGSLPAERLTLLSDIIVNNTVSGDYSGYAPDLAGKVTSLGYNLIGDDAGTSGLTSGQNHDQIGRTIDAKLGTLGDNGGGLPTIALNAGSPAIGTGFCGGSSTARLPIPVVSSDERGAPRKITCDSGAYESGAAVPTITPTGSATVILPAPASSTPSASPSPAPSATPN